MDWHAQHIIEVAVDSVSKYDDMVVFDKCSVVKKRFPNVKKWRYGAVDIPFELLSFYKSVALKVFLDDLEKAQDPQPVCNECGCTDAEQCDYCFVFGPSTIDVAVIESIIV